ncbi:MAG: Peptidoglycan binding protein [Parcubacteria group bacterium Licking1014_17]|nr:MAG: Peptidoglycan binding protein [Parcubacteria group bacterium Licking1014_17]
MQMKIKILIIVIILIGLFPISFNFEKNDAFAQTAPLLNTSNLTPPATWPDWLKKEWENNIEEVRKTAQEIGTQDFDNEDLPQLLQWADENKIRIISIGSDAFVAEGSLVVMPGVNNVFKGFKAIPPHLVKFLENETVNLANRSCQNGTGFIGLKEEKKKLNFLLCRPFNESIAVHEFGHVVDGVGIRNEKGNEFSFGRTDEGIGTLRKEYDRIFQISEEYQRMYRERLFTASPPGFISVYATRSELENFADHFRDYIFNAQYFRERAAKESLLAEKYEFLKNKIFLGKEYFEQKSVAQETKLEVKTEEKKEQKTESKFTKSLYRGIKNNEVKVLQEFLKKFPEIYPEGLITGYFGHLTEAAVKRLQGKYGIETVGIVGPKTRQKLNELVLTKPISTEKIEKLPASQTLAPPANWPDWLKKEWGNNIEEIRKTVKEIGTQDFDNEDLPQLFQWADEHKIEIVIISDRGVSLDRGSLVVMPGINQLFKGMKAMPPHIIKFLENETIKLINGSCFAPGSSSVASDLAVKEKGVNKVNFLLCRGFSASVFAHELGHIVDFIGIRNEKSNEFSFGKTDEGIRAFRKEYDDIFLSEEYERKYQEQSLTASPPPGFISSYAARAQVENFADHFSAYIFQTGYFRERATKEPLLAQKYEFLKTKIFLGKEY